MCVLNHELETLKQSVFFKSLIWIIILYDSNQEVIWNLEFYDVMVNRIKDMSNSSQRHFYVNHNKEWLESWSNKFWQTLLVVWLKLYNCLIWITWFQSCYESNQAKLWFYHLSSNHSFILLKSSLYDLI